MSGAAEEEGEQNCSGERGAKQKRRRGSRIEVEDMEQNRRGGGGAEL
jgi:hypothetical protein